MNVLERLETSPSPRAVSVSHTVTPGRDRWLWTVSAQSRRAGVPGPVVVESGWAASETVAEAAAEAAATVVHARLCDCAQAWMDRQDTP